MKDKRNIEELEAVLDRRLNADRKRCQPRGMKLPEDYFDQLIRDVEKKLPEQPAVERYVRMTTWQRVKPYVYLAAMFCGIWLMMNVFHRVSGNGEVSLDNPPAYIAQLMEEPAVHDHYLVVPSMMRDMEVVDEVAGAYDNIQEFAEDFEETEDETGEMTEN